MTVVYVLAHFDDEYCALPLIWEARREGVSDLRQSGLRKVMAGLTSLEEVLAVTNE